MDSRMYWHSPSLFFVTARACALQVKTQYVEVVYIPNEAAWCLHAEDRKIIYHHRIRINLLFRNICHRELLRFFWRLLIPRRWNRGQLIWPSYCWTLIISNLLIMPATYMMWCCCHTFLINKSTFLSSPKKRERKETYISHARSIYLEIKLPNKKTLNLSLCFRGNNSIS